MGCAQECRQIFTTVVGGVVVVFTVRYGFLALLFVIVVPSYLVAIRSSDVEQYSLIKCARWLAKPMPEGQTLV